MGHRLTRFCSAALVVLAGAAPAAGEAPAPDAFPLFGLSLECEGRTVTFTSGALVGTVHEHEGRRGGTQLVFAYRLQDAVLRTEDGQVLEAVGSASNSSVYVESGSEVGTFVANFTLVGSRGRQGAVHTLVRASEEGIHTVDRGQCRIAW